jgi:hypothetical protein
MTKLLILNVPGETTDHAADIVVIPGGYGPTPVKAMLNARFDFSLPVVLVAGRIELYAKNLVRKLAEARRCSSKWDGRIQFLERRVEVIKGVRFIGMHRPDVGFILAALEEPHDGPTVIVTYEPAPEDIAAVTLTGKVARWIHHTPSAEPLVVEI